MSCIRCCSVLRCDVVPYHALLYHMLSHVALQSKEYISEIFTAKQGTSKLEMPVQLPVC